MKQIATTYAPWLYEVLQGLWQRQPKLTIPQRWRAAWITCVPKRIIEGPKDIRPIALQCPIGKAEFRAIVRQALGHAPAHLQPYPLYAYLPGRSTEHALLQVHQHLRSVREQCQALTDTIWTRKAGHTNPQCRGGLTFISLDLSNAFDTINRKDIAEGMQTIDLPPDLQSLLMQWLTEVTYFVQHKQLSAPIPVTRGIRQGCVASPFLWLMWSIRFLEWTLEHLSMYADDIISQ